MKGRWVTLDDAIYPFYVPDGCFYDPELPDRIEQFCKSYMVWPKGFKEGEPIEFTQRQKDHLIRPLFGVRNSDTGFRNTKVCLHYSARGTGKTSLASIFGLCGLCILGDATPQIDLFASTVKQASKMFKNAKEIIDKSPILQDFLNIHEYDRLIIYPEVGGEMQVRTGDDETELGGNCTMILFDEIVAQKNAALWNTVITSLGKRPEELLLGLTTPGHKITSFVKSVYDYAKTIYEDRDLEPTYLPVIYEPKEDDDPFDKETWYKACPALKEGYLDIAVYEREAREASRNPDRLFNFRVYRLAQFRSSGRGFISLDQWDKGRQELPDIEYLKKLPSYCGLDIASSSDLASLCMSWWEPKGNKAYFLWKHWTTVKMNDLLNEWTHDGWGLWCNSPSVSITLSDYGEIDLKDVTSYIIELNRTFGLKKVGIDSYRSKEMKKKLISVDIEPIMINQTNRYMRASIERIQTLVDKESLRHNGDLVTRWCIGNVEVLYDSENFPRLVKKDLEEMKMRIDPADAACMSTFMRLEDEKEPEPVTNKVIRV